MKTIRRSELPGRVSEFQAAVTRNEVEYHGRVDFTALVAALGTSITVFFYTRPMVGDAVADIALGATFLVCFVGARVVYRS